MDSSTHGKANIKAHKHPNYFAVFIVLAIITALITGIELASDRLAFVPRAVINTAFIVMSVFKATLVAMFYMHLKNDSFVYTALFGLGILAGLFLVTILAVGYLI